jgi:hypothetical protein
MVAQGNVQGGNLVTNGLLLVQGDASVGNITTKDINGQLVRVSGNVSGANLVASGILSVAGTANVGNLNLPSTLVGISSVSYSGTTITVVTATAHGASVGTEFTLTGITTNGTNPPNINTGGNPAWFTVTSVTNSTTFVFTAAVAPTGTLNISAGSLNIRPFLISTGSATYGGNLTATGNVVAGAFTGVGSGLTSLNASAITSGTISSSLIPTLNQSTTGFAGTVSASSQPNITSVGTLLSLAVSGTHAVQANLAITATSGTGTVATLTFADPGYVPYPTGQSIVVSGLVPAGYNGTFTVITGTNTTVTYTNATSGAMTSAAGVGRIVGGVTITPSGNINAGYIKADGSLLTNINGGAVSKVQSATSADSASTVTGSDQTAITKVGVLTGLSISGSISSVTNITASGFVMHSAGVGIAAAGTAQGTATPLTKQINVVSSSTASVNDGVMLPAGAAGMTCIIINTASANIKVYPSSGSYIDGLAQNTSFTLGPGARLMFVATSLSQWYTMTAVYG